MRAGALTQRVTIERMDYRRDEDGNAVQDPHTGEVRYDWLPLATVWASVEPLTGREFIAAMAVQAETTARIRMRYRPYLTAQDRVVHDGQVYEIETVIDVKSAAREMHLMCKRLA